MMFKKPDLSKRNFGLDLLRTVAVLFVPAVHFFLNNYYYSFTMTQPVLMVTNSFRWLFYTGVPLFIMMSGYLKRNKTVSKNHYKTIIPILISYLIISIGTTLFRIFYLKEEFSTFVWIRNIFTFDTPSYAWYVKMYIGLFLLMPFLNNAYNWLGSRKQKNILILTMLFLTVIPTTINHFKVEDNALGFVSNYWASIWPITYYFIGMYIAEYKPRINKTLGWGLITILSIGQGVLTYFTAKGQTFYASGMNSEYNDIITVINSVLIFICVYNVECKKKVIHYPLYKIGSVSLSLYLCSFMADRIVYTYFSKLYPKQFVDIKSYIWLFPLIQICVVGLSFIGASVVDFVTALIIKSVTFVANFIRSKRRSISIDKARTQEFSIIR